MSRPPSEHVRRPSPAMPASPSRPNLTVRTSLQPTLSSSASLSATSSTPEQPYPKYPLPIPFDKQDKAAKLYKDYQDAKRDAKREEEFAQLQSHPLSAPSNHHGYLLSVPNTPAPQSATSRTSSQRSTSAYGMVTDISSVMSFEGNENPSAKPKSELSAYDGTRVKQRTRKRFNKTQRARTALIRHLGSCSICHKRRVPCDPEKHHDIKTLEAILQAKANRMSSHSQQQPLSTIAGPSRQDAEPASAEQAAGVTAQTDLLGFGDQLQIQTDVDLAELDIQFPAFGDAPSQDISASAPLYNQEPDVLALDLNPYASYSHGEMLHIGTLRVDKMFECKHLYCFETFATFEALQTHFEYTHFPFTRIDPAHRFTCGTCSSLNDLITEPCYNCGGQVEIRVYGNYIRTPSYHHYSPDGQDSLRNFTPSTPFNPSAYNIPQTNIPDDPANYNGGANQGGYTPDPYNNLPPNSGTQYQGNTFQRALHIVESKPYSLQPKPSRWRKPLLALSLLFLALTLCLSYTWAFTKLQELPRHISGLKTNLPAMGFVGIVASAVMYSSVMQRKSSRSPNKQKILGMSAQKCPLHAPVKWMGARVRAPETFILGGRFS